MTDLECLVLTRILPLNPKLKKLNLSRCVLKRYSFFSLAEFLETDFNLRYLDVSGNGLERMDDAVLDKFLGAIGEHCGLEEVRLNAGVMGCPVGECRRAGIE